MLWQAKRERKTLIRKSREIFGRQMEVLTVFAILNRQNEMKLISEEKNKQLKQIASDDTVSRQRQYVYVEAQILVRLSSVKLILLPKMHLPHLTR